MAFGSNPNAASVSFVAVYADSSGTAFTEGVSDGALQASTYVTLVAAPAAGTRRIIKSITFYNNHSSAIGVSLDFDNNGTKRRIVQLLIGVGQTWSSDDLGSTGTFKLVNNSTPIEGGTNGSVLYNVNGTLSEIARTGTSTLVSSVSPTIATPTIITPSVQDSITSTSTGFNLINTTATTVNFAGAATTLNIGGAASATTSLSAGSGSVVNLGGGANAAELRFLEPSGSGTNYTALKAQAQAANVTYTLPAADGSNGQVLATNGSGLLSWAAGGTGGGNTFKNRLINGSFMIDQRYSGVATTIANDAYCFDRWYVLRQSGNVQSSLIENAESSPNNIPNAIRLTNTHTSTQKIGLAQIIESNNCRDLRGKSVTLSFRVRTNVSSCTIRYAVLSWTNATADSVVSNVVNNWASTTYTTNNFFINNANIATITNPGTVTPTVDTWTTVTPLTVTLDSSITNVIVFIWTETALTDSTGRIDLANVQLEAGSSSTDFEVLPRNVMMAQCMYYAQVIGGTVNGEVLMNVGTSRSQTQVFLPFQLGSRLRVTPALSYIGTVGTFTLGDGASAAIALTAIELSVLTGTMNGLIIATVANPPGLATFRPYFLAASATTARLILDSEL